MGIKEYVQQKDIANSFTERDRLYLPSYADYLIIVCFRKEWPGV